jgi:hypothetical protein
VSKEGEEERGGEGKEGGEGKWERREGGRGSGFNVVLLAISGSKL